MITIRESLRGITNFPIPEQTIEVLATKRGLTSLDDDVTQESIASREFKLVVADMYAWLYRAANMSQGGQSYNFTTEDKKLFKAEANRIYNALNEKDDIITGGATYGYKGSRL